jgi:hypothetical protein
VSRHQAGSFVLEPARKLKRAFAGGPLTPERRTASVFVYDFDVDSTALMPRHTDVLRPQIDLLRAQPKSAVVSVVGRASQTGPEANNRLLSRERAERVRAYLVANGVPEDRVGPVVFHGSENPLVDVPAEESELNRSVQVVIDWVDLPADPTFGLGGSTEWQLDLTVTFGVGAGIGGQMQIGTLTNLVTGEHHEASANILGIDFGHSVGPTAAFDLPLPDSPDGVFSMPHPPGPVDFEWFDGRFITLTAVGASALGGVDFSTLRFRNPDGPWPEAVYHDIPIGVTIGIGGVATIGFLNVDL